ncbi:glycoside hydrolase family 35 protein [Paenibacillus glycanilyticus]|uniref:Beta-galactosidase n=1 Tax=Paenibacillus glycanilyticus TaxID=126569 RepID=A0ABQ6GB17_9BACL|nr:beta-galactosidase family protein [Paenibacillus glycanilyticus]GLX67240.1 beta-galactosidase [Paenibacillus glycanilyticus]
MASKFEIKEQFYLNDKPFKIISGAIHYFRVVPQYWRDRLEKLKLMGCNTVETYVPWNMHEPQEGSYAFEDGLNLREFIATAQEVGLFVILRPAPYICAEWEFGGLPYWLLKDPMMKLRFSYPPYMEKVSRYFEHLLPQVLDMQITHGGPIILMQVENEYGGYANDKTYMKQLADLMIEKGVNVPLVTSDGPWHDMLENGSIPDQALPTINCGSKIKEHFKRLREFHGTEKPLMVMEFWIGWFDAWGDEKHHTTDGDSAAQELADILEEGSVNIYMFHGGTNFGFTSGANYYEKLAPDVTSYDYDALLTEWGDITPKYELFKKVISQHAEIPDFPLSTVIKKAAYGELKVTNRVSLFATLDTLSAGVHSAYPLTMEELNQSTGYIYYRSNIGPARRIEDYRLITCMDRAHTFINNELKLTQYDHEIGVKQELELTAPSNELGILVENMGRVNYSVKMNHQHKGIKDGVIVNGAFHSEWDMFSLPMDNLDQVDFSKGYSEGQPSFSRFEFDVEEAGDTFVDVTGWGKGFVVVNGFNIGRFWEIGPQARLYVPAPILRVGKNEIIVFESDGKVADSIILTDEPKLSL